MATIIKKSGKKEKFIPAKVKKSVEKASKEAKITPVKIREISKEITDSISNLVKRKKIMRASELRKAVLGRLERRAKKAAAAWRKYDKKVKKKKK